MRIGLCARTEAAALEPALQQPRDSISEHSEQDHDADIIRQEEHKRLVVIEENKRQLPCSHYDPES